MTHDRPDPTDAALAEMRRVLRLHLQPGATPPEKLTALTVRHAAGLDDIPLKDVVRLLRVAELIREDPGMRTAVALMAGGA